MRAWSRINARCDRRIWAGSSMNSRNSNRCACACAFVRASDPDRTSGESREGQESAANRLASAIPQERQYRDQFRSLKIAKTL